MGGSGREVWPSTAAAGHLSRVCFRSSAGGAGVPQCRSDACLRREGAVGPLGRWPEGTFAIAVDLEQRVTMTRFALLCGSPLSRSVILASGLILFQSLPIFAAQGSSAEQAQSSAAVFQIAGTIVNSIGGNPLGRARVSILDAHNPKNVQSMVTSEDGRFEFMVSPGKYALQGAKRGFITASYD